MAHLDGRFPGGQNLLFQGLWTDPVTGLSYARNRWYDARNASWLSEDPKGAVDSTNLYAFVGWGPHVGRDPLGLYEIPEEEMAAWRAAHPNASTGELMEWIDSKYDEAGAQEAPWYDKAFKAAGRAFSWIGGKKEQLAQWAGKKARGGVERAIPTAEVDSDRQLVAELTGQGNTVAGGGGAHLQNQIREEGAEIAEEGAETGTRVAVEVGQDYLLGVGVGKAARATKARYRYEPEMHGYRDMKTGRTVAQKGLPYPGTGFASQGKGTLKKGVVVDRYGRPSGRYAGRPGATVSERGMPPGSEALEYRRYEVIKPIDDVVYGPAAPVPEFDAVGGATQYLFKEPIEVLVKKGYLKELS